MHDSVFSNYRRTVVFAGMAVLAVLFACLLVASPAQAATRTVRSSGYTWDAATGTLTVTSNAGTTNWQTAVQDRTAVQHIVIADGVTSIRGRAFANTGATDVTIAGTVGYIGANAFRDCTGLTTISIPYSVTSIADNAFRGSGIYSITLADNYDVPNWLEDILETQMERSGLSSFVLYVPTSMVESYDDALDLTEAETDAVINVRPITASPYAATVALTDADAPGYAVFNAGVAAQIRGAATNGVVNVTTEEYLSFDRQVYEALEDRADVEVVVDYSYHETSHRCYIAAGTKVYFLYDGRAYVTFEYLESKN